MTVINHEKNKIVKIFFCFRGKCKNIWTSFIFIFVVVVEIETIIDMLTLLIIQVK